MKPLSEQNLISQLSIDCVIFGFHERQLKVLLPKFKMVGDFWALPSGFIAQDEGIDETAHRILEERTGISPVFMEQFRTFGRAGRSNKALMEEIFALNEGTFGGIRFSDDDLQWFTRRFVSVGYFALVDIAKVKPVKTFLDESIGWYNIRQLPKTILDHNEMIEKALQTLQLYVDQKPVAFHLLPETFTMKEVQDLYETIFDRPFRRNNFQKKILELNVLERLDKKFTGAANKAPYLYRVRKN